MPRPTGGGAPSGQVPVSRRVNPADADSGVDQENGRGALPERGRGGGAPAERDAAAEALAVTAKPLAVPKDSGARASVDNALQRLLREARDLRREEPAPAIGEVATAADSAQDSFQKATDAYSQQESLRGRAEVLRPGAVFSATF